MSLISDFGSLKCVSNLMKPSLNFTLYTHIHVYSTQPASKTHVLKWKKNTEELNFKTTCMTVTASVLFHIEEIHCMLNTSTIINLQCTFNLTQTPPII